MEKKAIEIEISPDEKEAYVTLNLKPINSDDESPAIKLPEIETIVSAIKTAGIVAEIDMEAINTAIETESWDRKITVARATSPRTGEEGSVDYLFSTNLKPKPKVLDDGKVDYHDIGVICFVKKDEPIARRIPPKMGIIGRTVKGNPIPALKGNEANISPGPNTYFAEGKDDELRAACAGSVSLDKDKIVKVEKTVHLKEGVNYSTGDVDFPGDVFISGDVRSGFTVNSGGNVEIIGVVEDAVIEAKGDILVKGGFTGSGKGQIKSEKNVIVKFIENQNVEAKDTVQIGESCMHGFVTANNNIELNTGKGLVIGGHLKARKNITAKVIGNVQQSLTKIELLGSEEFYAEIRKVEAEIEELKQRITQVKTALGALRRQKAEQLDPDPKLLEQLRSLQDTHFQMDDDIKNKEVALEKQQKTGEYSGEIQILSKVHPGAMFIAGEVELVLTQEAGKATLKRVEEEIVNIEGKQSQEAEAES